MNQIIQRLSEYISPDYMYTDVLEWLEDLIKCPSQCSFYFQYRGTRYELYLRWRHEDPWTGALIAYPSDCEDSIWRFLDGMPSFTEEQLPDAEYWMLVWLLNQLETGRDLLKN